ncbi:MAG: metallophosphoesterase family protein [Spirochaetota bacterium]
MTKILIISDSHESPKTVSAIVRAELPFDELVFCGDGLSDLASAEMPNAFIISAVTGNVDRARGFNGPDQLLTEIGGKKIFITHGDLYGVKYDLSKLRCQGLRQNADIVLFGHTHEQLCDSSAYPMLINPGAAKFGLYCTLEIDGDRIHPEAKAIA